MTDSRNAAALAVVLAGAVASGLAGCKPDRALHSGVVVDGSVKPAGRPQRPAQPAKADTGTVAGVVHFKGTVPERIRIDMSLDPACGITGGTNRTEQYLVKDGGLANVYVYVKDGPAEAMNVPAPAKPQPVVLDQVGCRYVPHVAAVMRGGTVEFRNSDGTMHNIHTMPAVNPGVDVSEGAKGSPVQRRFDKPEVMMPVQCNNHPWMNAFLNVSATPFFAVTDATGRFDISGLPPGTYTLAAVHEKLGEQTLTVTVSSKSRSTAEFTYTAK